MADRTILIGDIHGCQRTLDALLKKIAYTPEEDRIIFVGDYIDRGPHIRETLDHLSRLQEKAGDRAVFLMGNHEKMLLDVADSTWKGRRFFVTHAGAEYGVDLDDIDTACVFDRSLTEMIIIGRQFYFESAANCESGTEEERERDI